MRRLLPSKMGNCRPGPIDHSRLPHSPNVLASTDWKPKLAPMVMRGVQVGHRHADAGRGRMQLGLGTLDVRRRSATSDGNLRDRSGKALACAGGSSASSAASAPAFADQQGDLAGGLRLLRQQLGQARARRPVVRPGGSGPARWSGPCRCAP